VNAEGGGAVEPRAFEYVRVSWVPAVLITALWYIGLEAGVTAFEAGDAGDTAVATVLNATAVNV
jgi:hypothetical protein